MAEMKAIDLACGAGGWACAARGLPIRFVAVADWAEDCLETVTLNHARDHPGCAMLNCDLKSEDGRRQVLDACRAAGGVDLVLGAIPCEQLSQARANRALQPGELEALHALIDSCFGLVKELAPRFWVFEDVIQVEGHLPPPIEYGVNYDVRRIQAADYGPQKRLRTFFGRFPPPAAPEPGPRTLGEVLRPGPYRTLPQLAKYERSKSKWYGRPGEKKCRVQEPAGPGGTVTSSQGGCGSNAERSGMVPVQDLDAPSRTVFAGGHGPSTASQQSLTVPLARVLDAGQPGPTVADFGRTSRGALVSIGNGDPRFAWERSQSAEEAAFTVAAGHGDRGNAQVEQEDLIRVMEWQEAALLQGFPADYIFAASWSRTWKLVAQAIPIQVGRAILKAVVAEWEKDQVAKPRSPRKRTRSGRQ